MKKVYAIIMVFALCSLWSGVCLSQDKDPGLAGYWKFDEGKGEQTRDSSGNKNDGEVLAEWVKGSFGSCLFFDGQTNVIVPGSASLEFGKGDFTIQAWLAPKANGADLDQQTRRIMGKTGYPEKWWVVDLVGEGGVEMEMAYKEGDQYIGGSTSSDGKLPLNAWTLMTIAVDRKNFKVSYYFNGKLDSAKDLAKNYTLDMDVDGQQYVIGGDWQPFIGLIDEIKFYKRALTPAEIKAYYDKEKGSRTSVKYEGSED